MTQADSVHSTPPTNTSKAQNSLESQITECFLMAELAAIAVNATLSDREPQITADQAAAVCQAVYQLAEAVRELRTQYFDGIEKAVA
jgi:hypothetical protein